MSNIAINDKNVNNLTSFSFDNKDIRVVNIDHEAWFVANDVASVLGYSKPRNAIAMHCKAAISIGALNQGSLDPQTKIIPERDVYRLIMRSKLPSAEQFEEKVVAEILPSIRKTGGYMVSIPDETPEQTLSRALLLAQNTMERQKEELAQLKPKAEGLDLIASHEGLFCLRVAAKNLSMKPMALIDYLSQKRWIHKNQGKGNWIAYQDKINAGYLKHKSISIHNSDGELTEKSQVLITPKGLAKLAQIFSHQAA